MFVEGRKGDRKEGGKGTGIEERKESEMEERKNRALPHELWASCRMVAEPVGEKEGNWAVTLERYVGTSNGEVRAKG